MNVPDPLNVNQVNANKVLVTQLVATEVTGTGGQGAVITASKINLGGWILESADDGIYVTTPDGIRTKMELIDFRQVPIPPTATLQYPSNRASVGYTEIPGGPQKTPGGQLGAGSASGGGGAVGATSTNPGVPYDAPGGNKFTPGGDGVGYQPITDAAKANLPPSCNNPEFLGCLDNLAKEKNVPADSFLTCFQIESGLNSTDGGSPPTGARAVNPGTQASGLNQIMPATAKSLGYTTAQIQGMSASEQMCGPVTAYFRHTTMPEKPTTTDLYLANFYPAAVGQSDDYVIGNHPGLSPQSIASANPAFVGAGGVVTVGSVKNWIKTKYPP